jgi:hypothetical protein
MLVAGFFSGRNAWIPILEDDDVLFLRISFQVLVVFFELTTVAIPAVVVVVCVTVAVIALLK